MEVVLQRYLTAASAGFLYKMLRKKNITLNGKKATGKERLQSGDIIRIWFSEETLEKFAGKPEEVSVEALFGESRERLHAHAQDFAGWILYEDPHILIVNKPSGMLTQKAEAKDHSLNDAAAEYLVDTGQIDPQSMVFIRPSACNRLDRNTSGIVTIGKTQLGLQILTALFRERTVHKDYLCIALGRISEEMTLEGSLTKDEQENKAIIGEAGEDGKKIRTRIRPRGSWKAENGMELSLLEIRLYTGRTHQIRAHLASIGHPILGDRKYGDEQANVYAAKLGIRSQLLHAYRLEFPEDVEKPLKELSGKVFTARPPREFLRAVPMDEHAENGSKMEVFMQMMKDT